MRTRQEALLEQDLDGIQAFLDEFDPPANGEEREVELNSTGEVVVIRNLPLPDGMRPDYCDVCLLVHDYPSRPPIGIYVLERNNDEVIAQLRRMFNVLDQGHYGAPTVRGFQWICTHYAGNTWRYNPNHLSRGDNLRKFILNFYNRIQSDLGG